MRRTRDNMEGVPYLPLTDEQITAMKKEYLSAGTCSCPLCEVKSEPWGGMWFCVCGAIVKPQ